MQPECSKLYLRMAPELIHFLRFILEGYDGFAVLTTIDPKDGVVVLRFPAAVADDLLRLLIALGPALQMKT